MNLRHLCYLRMKNNKKPMRPEQQYIDLYTQAEALLRSHSAEPLNTLRARAFADFERLGFPTRRQEDYKYTDIAKCFAPDYGMNSAATCPTSPPRSISW